MRRTHLLLRQALIGLLLGVSLTPPISPARAAVLKLSDPLTGQVNNFQISPNGQFVVYEAGPLRHIYSVPISGGTPVQLNLPPEPPFQVGLYAISPDSQWVIYTLPPQSGQGFTTPTELFRVPIAGPASASVKLNSSLVSGGSVLSFSVSPDGGRVVYRADAEADGRFELYSVPLDGSAAPIKLNPQLATGGNVLPFFRITPDSSRVVYLADQDVDEQVELYSTPIAGPATSAIKLNGSLTPNGDVGFGTSYFVISPDSARVVYQADQDTDEMFELYSVPTAGGQAPSKLNVALGADQDVSPNSFSISPNSQRVVYLVAGVPYAVPIDGPGSANVNLRDPSIVAHEVSGVSVTNDSQRALFFGYPGSGNFRAYLAPIGGPASAAVYSFSAEAYQRSNSSDYVVYHTGAVGGSIFSQRLADPPDSGVQLNSIGSEGPQGYRISPDDSRIAYIGRASDGTRELYSVPITGPYTDSVKISGPLTTGGNVEYSNGFQFSPDGRRVVYRADAETDGLIELYVTDAGAILPLNRVFLPLIRR